MPLIVTATADDDRSVLMGSLYMLVLTALLFWIPAIGPFAAGFVGGRKAGSPSWALLAAILPAALAGVLVYYLVAAIPEVAPFIAAVLAGAFTLWLIVQSGLVLVGALVGGWTYDATRRLGTTGGA